MMPASVSTVMSSFFTMPRSYTYLAKQRMPLPHISASLPSAFTIRMRISAVSEGSTTSMPSPPTLTRLVHSFAASLFQSRPVPSSSNTRKSLPSPCILVNSMLIPPRRCTAIILLRLIRCNLKSKKALAGFLTTCKVV